MRGHNLVALVLAVGLVLAVNLFTVAVLVLTVTGGTGVSLSDNTSHLLSAALGGVVGILGSYLGHQVRHRPGDVDELEGPG